MNGQGKKEKSSIILQCFANWTPVFLTQPSMDATDVIPMLAFQHPYFLSIFILFLLREREREREQYTIHQLLNKLGAANISDLNT